MSAPADFDKVEDLSEDPLTPTQILDKKKADRNALKVKEKQEHLNFVQEIANRDAKNRKKVTSKGKFIKVIVSIHTLLENIEKLDKQGYDYLDTVPYGHTLTLIMKKRPGKPKKKSSKAKGKEDTEELSTDE